MFGLVPLPDCSAFVLQQVIDLFYKGQIMVAAEVKPRIENALRFLQVADIVVQNAATPQNSSTDDNGKRFYEFSFNGLEFETVRLFFTVETIKDLN